MTEIERKLRTAQLISPSGVGAIVDLGGRSYIGDDISRWGRGIDKEIIHLSRLQQILGVRYFRIPPEAPERDWQNARKIRYSYFPRWMFCKTCKSLKRYLPNDITPDEPPLCFRCNTDTLSPIRFVAGCEDGHLQDINWNIYVHINQENNEQRQCGNPYLKFETISGRGGGLAANQIRCETCRAERNLQKLLVEPIPEKCFGKQPWEYFNEEEQAARPVCNKSLSGYQRGGSLLYSPTIVSALDIPIDEAQANNEIRQRIQAKANEHELFYMVKENPNPTSIENFAKALQRTEFQDIEIEIIVQCVNLALEEHNQNDGEENINFDPEVEIDEELILEPEWQVLMGPAQKLDKRFWSEPYDLNVSDLEEKNIAVSKMIDHVSLIKRLREVRVLKSFTRFYKSKEIAVCNSSEEGVHLPWLPALEVIGEGIFINFNKDILNEWEEKNFDYLESRLKDMIIRRDNSNYARLPIPDPSFVMLHTLAHLLIRQLCFDSGYQASALRERIYYKKGVMSGFLIYTADSDSEGAMGGLVKQGEANNLMSAINSSLRSARWCSNDPVCINAGGQGLEGLNKGACHSCALISTTSCTFLNTLLDRELLIGDQGFFKDNLSLNF